jgi:hypothetical protein
MKMRTVRIISAGIALGVGAALLSPVLEFGKCKPTHTPAIEFRTAKPESDRLAPQLTTEQKIAITVWRRTTSAFKEKFGITPEQ